MTNRIWLIFGLIAGTAALSGCVPVAIGAGAVLIADEAIEQDQGGDGLF